MATECEAQKSFTMSDLLTKPNLILQTSDALFNDDDEDYDDELFSFSNNPNLTNSEMLKYLNLDNNDYENDTEQPVNIAEAVPFGISFEAQKANMNDITGDGKIWKSIKRAGVGEIVPSDALVSVHYVGYFEYQDEPFDSSYMRQSCERIRLNHGTLIPGLDLGIQSMRKHEIAHFVIAPEYAYGPLGCPPRIPPNETVMFAVYLIDFLDNIAAQGWENLDREQRKCFAIVLPKVNAMHETANDDFKRNKIKQAIRGYARVAGILKDVRLENEAEEAQQQKFLSKVLTNLSICYNKIQKPRKACLSCQSVPIPTSKTYLHHGRALVTIGEFDAAREQLTKAKALDPTNKKIIQEIQLLNDKMRSYRTTEKKLWAQCWQARDEANDMNEYTKYARKICLNFANDKSLLRQALPTALRENEIDCFRDQAAILGLLFTKHERFGETTFYLSKRQY